jgi:hypothetical protein
MIGIYWNLTLISPNVQGTERENAAPDLLLVINHDGYQLEASLLLSYIRGMRKSQEVAALESQKVQLLSHRRRSP